MASIRKSLLLTFRCDKCDGLCGLRRLAKHHPETLAKELPAVVQAVTAEVKNLRSTVCRMAAILIGEMCASLKKRMDPVSSL